MEKVHLNHIETHIVNHCNLNCKGCDHFSPLHDPWFKNLNEFEEECKKISKKFELGKIMLLGGEPLLHPQVIDFLRTARKYFPNSDVELVTNGILFGKLEPFIEEFNQDNYSLFLTNYGLENLRWDLVDKIKKKRIINHTYEMYNPGIDLKGGHDPAYEYQRCDSKRYECLYFQDGYFYTCAVMAHSDVFAKYFGKELNFDREQIRMHIDEHSAEEIYDFLHRPNIGCSFCDMDFRHSHIGVFQQSKKNIYEWINEEKNPYALL